MHQAIFWDFDGTLVHSDSLWSRSVYRAIHTVMPECPISYPAINAHMRTGFTWHTPDRDHTSLVGDMWWQHMLDRFASVYQSLGIDPEIARQASRTVRQIIKSVDSYILYDDAVSVLQACSERDYKNYILSNNYPDLADVRGGQAAGMKTILVHPRLSQLSLAELDRTQSDQPRQSGADHTFYSLTEILTAI